MQSFNKLAVSVFLAITCALSVSGSPSPSPSSLRHATHRTRNLLPRDLQIEPFHPSSTFETFESGIDHPLAKRAGEDLESAAIAFAGSHLSIDTNTISFKSGYSGDIAHNAFLTQTKDGIPFANAVANVAFNKDDKVVSFGSSFVKPKSIASSKPTITLDTAISKAEKALNGKYNSHPATLEYLVKADNTVALTHVMQIRNEESGTWFEAFIDAHSGELLSITDFVNKAISYRVLPLQEEILTQGFQTLTDPQDTLASPNGWVTASSTSGNNAVAFKGSQTNVTTGTQTANGLSFVFTQDPTRAPTVQTNIDAARTNAFYVVNSIHDLTYRYGFTESAFNFQTNNFGLGGKGSDAVTISVQSSAGTDNADFSTPPDGQPGAMRMFLWDLTTPNRDGALENDIVVHENTHGVSNRLTGGGTARCLQTTEAGGMGEGWSDAMAEWTETSASVPDYVLGQFVTNKAAGIRSHPYSTNAATNPLRYSSLKTLTEVHSIGEVWANILHNVLAALVGAHGFSTTARTNPSGTEGNIVFMHLFLDAMALQPCNPTFLTARTAWIQADANRYAGANACTLWKAFASRGLGVSAANHVDDTTVPSTCK